MLPFDLAQLGYWELRLAADWLSKHRKQSISEVDLVSGQISLSRQEVRLLNQKLAKLAQGYPLDYLLSQIQFAHLQIKVLPGVFIPRPETEAWLQKLRQTWPAAWWSDVDLVVDMCAGTGVLGLSLADLVPQVVCADRSVKAIKNIFQNLALNHITNCQVFQSDLFANSQLTNLIKASPNWVLVCNPPYVPTIDEPYRPERNLQFEPKRAIFSGRDGLSTFRRLVHQLDSLPKPKLVVFELDPRNIRQAQKLLDPWFETEVWLDDNGWERVLVGIRK